MNVPFNLQIWDAQECAEYLKQEKSTFLKRTQFETNFPRRCPIPGQPRWPAKAVTEWALGTMEAA
jgi:predicted DNA-binding transcriptional regulator AlpA